MNDQEKIQFSRWTDLAVAACRKAAWFSAGSFDNPRVVLRVYRSIRVPEGVFNGGITRLVDILNKDPLIRVGAGRLVSDTSFKRLRAEFSSPPDGSLHIDVTNDDRLLRKGLIIYIATPVLPMNDVPSLQAAFDRLNQTVNVTRAVLGQNLLWDAVVDRLFNVENPDQDTSERHRLSRIPQPEGTPDFSEWEFEVTAETLHGKSKGSGSHGTTLSCCGSRMQDVSACALARDGKQSVVLRPSFDCVRFNAPRPHGQDQHADRTEQMRRHGSGTARRAHAQVLLEG